MRSILGSIQHIGSTAISLMVENERRIIGQIQEQGDPLHAAVLLEISGEEPARFEIDSHGSKHDREVLLVPIVDVLGGLIDKTSLTADLSGDLVMGQTGGREDGDLLASSNRVHGVDGRDPGCDHFFGIDLELLSRCLPELDRSRDGRAGTYA